MLLVFVKALPKEIVIANDLRTTLIPKLKEALPVLDRLQKKVNGKNLPLH
jgi:hypothetical protein